MPGGWGESQRSVAKCQCDRRSENLGLVVTLPLTHSAPPDSVREHVHVCVSVCVCVRVVLTVYQALLTAIILNVITASPQPYKVDIIITPFYTWGD